LADIGNSHSEELLDVPEGVKVTIKTRNVVVEGEWTDAHVEGTFMANFSQVPA
jgi:ribosomal protein L6P/L9E